MRVDVLTLFPEMFRALTEHGVSGRAVSQSLTELHCWDPRDYTRDRHRRVDDRAYGGGPGMVMQIEPLLAALDAAKASVAAAGVTAGPVLALSPQGRRFDQALARELVKLPQLTLVAGRYEGIDERFIEAQVDQELSVGDFVTSGGELPAMLVIDAVWRLLPEVLGHPQSAVEDSFSDGLLDCPHYTRPERFGDAAVPAVLLSGDHAAIRRWRRQQQLGRTWLRRPDLLAGRELSAEDQAWLAAFREERQSAAQSDTGDGPGAGSYEIDEHLTRKGS